LPGTGGSDLSIGEPTRNSKSPIAECRRHQSRQRPSKIDNIDLELLQSNRVVESRKLGLEAIQRIADSSAKLQATEILQ